MACTDSPRQSGSGLDHLLKNAEFENVQQAKAIKTERERIQAYEHQLEKKERRTVELEKSILDLDEQAKKLHKQFTFSRDNYESLRRTSTVLSDHEEALKRKLYSTKKEVEEECTQQNIALTKYHTIWTTYQAKYDSMQKVQELKREQEEIHLLSQKDTELDAQISNIDQTLKNLKMEMGKRASLTSWVVQIAQLRVERDQLLKCVRMDCNLAKDLQVDSNQLQENVSKAETRLKELQLAQQKRLIEEANKMASRSDGTDEAMDTHKSSDTATQSSSLQHRQRGSEKQTINTSHIHIAPLTDPTHSVAEITPPPSPSSIAPQVSRFVAQNKPPLRMSTPPPMITLPQRTANTSSKSNPATVASPLRYKLSVPTLSMPPRASVTGTKSPSIIVSQPYKVPPQIPTVQRYSQHSTTVSSPLSVTTIAKNNIQQSTKSSTSIPQVTIQTPARLSSSVSTTALSQPRVVHSLPKSSLLQTPLTNSTQPTAHSRVVPAANLSELNSSSDTHQVKTGGISVALLGRNTGNKSSQSTPSTIGRDSHSISFESPNSSSSANVEVGRHPQQQTESADDGTQAMDTESTPVGSGAAMVSIQQQELQQSVELSRMNEIETGIVDETSTTFTQHLTTARDVNTEHSGTNVAGHDEANIAATTTPGKEIEQPPNTNTLFPLQHIGDGNGSINATDMVTTGGLYSIEPNTSASVGDHGYNDHHEMQQHGEGRETGGGNEMFQNQTAFTGDQMMFPVGDGIQFYTTASEANYGGGDFFSFSGNDQAGNSGGHGFSFGTPSSTPTMGQGDNTGFAFSFGESATPESGDSSSFFSF